MRIKPLCYRMVFVIALLGAFALHAAERITTAHFVVEYREGSSYMGELVAKAAEDGFRDIARKLGYTPDRTIRIVLAADDAEFDSLTMNELPDWSAAVALSSDMIVLSPLAGRKIGIERIVRHETAHCFIEDAARVAHVPRWFHEGCAEYVSGEIGVRGTAYIIIKTLRRELMTFDDIEDVFSVGSEDAALAYDQSLLAVNYLMTLNGPSVLGVILSRMAEGEDFDRAFLEATGVTAIEFEKSCLAHIRDTYGWRTAIIYVPGTWTIILALAFIVYFIKKIRNRRTMKKWESERPGNVIDFEPPSDDFFEF